MLSPSHHLPRLLLLLLLLRLPAAAQGKGSSGRGVATAALRLLERGDTRSALALLRKATEGGGDAKSDGRSSTMNTENGENAENAAQLQAALGVAALDQNFYAEAERAARLAALRAVDRGRRGNGPGGGCPCATAVGARCRPVRAVEFLLRRARRRAARW